MTAAERVDDQHVDDRYLDYAGSFNRLEDEVCLAAPPESAMSELTADFSALAARVAEHRVDYDRRPTRYAGMSGLPHPILVPYEVHEDGPTSTSGTVEFGLRHMGNENVVHGGIISMMFDDFIGMFVSRSLGSGSSARTAYLNVDYRSMTPVGRPLSVSAEIASVQGRKAFVEARICDGETLCAEAHALFVCPADQMWPGVAGLGD
ncbi:PaaI family thioesterase [Gordonia humi]|uniref:Acyl-coenzyme A thioesterase THEM4 n=1 Tax=Gordonia humi TaxID=686429 RepID=A0A840EU19_9ACTN|nr:PaaI family thioesterase [Gordonia humi]MBB4135192.1 acyl-coenzyme A thioesterase PaaI-like protein [Gordonia humi]